LDRYLVRLGNTSSRYAPAELMILLRDLRTLVDEFGCVVKNLRVTTQAVEFDLYSPSDEAKKCAESKIESKYGKIVSERNLRIDETYANKESTLNASIRLFNEQRFWECHETMEQIWRKEKPGPEKDVQQGLILAASALVHHQKDEDEVCLNMIPRTLEKLDKWTGDAYLSLNVRALKDNLNRIYKSRVVIPFAL
jgi:uncharacterized protein